MRRLILCGRAMPSGRLVISYWYLYPRQTFREATRLAARSLREFCNQYQQRVVRLTIEREE